MRRSQCQDAWGIPRDWQRQCAGSRSIIVREIPTVQFPESLISTYSRDLVSVFVVCKCVPCTPKNKTDVRYWLQAKFDAYKSRSRRYTGKQFQESRRNHLS